MKVIVATVGLSLLAAAAYAQAPRERTIEEIKIEAQARAERGGYAPRKALAFARWQLAQWKKCNSDGSSPVIGRPQGWRCAPPPPAAAALTPSAHRSAGFASARSRTERAVPHDRQADGPRS
jgi:hypothetical protein